MTRLRIATHRDAADMRSLYRTAFAPAARALGYRPSPMDRDFASAIDARLALVAERDGVAAGYAVASRHPDRLYLEAIAVAPAYQGAGLGRRLVLGVERLASELCLRRVELNTDPRLEGPMAFYRALGYRVVRRAEPGGGPPSVRYGKRVRTELERVLGVTLPSEPREV